MRSLLQVKFFVSLAWPVAVCLLHGLLPSSGWALPCLYVLLPAALVQVCQLPE